MSQACTVVVEGITDRLLLERLLEEELASGLIRRIVEAGGRSAAESLGRTVLAVRRQPVVVVMDADSTDQEAIAARRSYLESALAMVGPPPLWRVVLAVPVLEACLLDHPDVAADLLGHALSPSELELAEEAPTLLLSRAGVRKPAIRDLVARLDDGQVRALRGTRLIAEVVAAVRDLAQPLVA
ncbi:MAG: hypothetical protein HYU66_23790 [Armatimonadetes bacterium]|nr:hypothetical protein [Armatimonadota bacterium]